ncbi:uncharacterized protein LOC111895070 [Lactuca sativa]|uniref:uncharacterized protein LOC111895070 n=1 Tax=Lactuca sativa TaxID=4236 RepID=UPI0022AE9A80|nr:uncharacterized protein LOC111895070 [Lactuca sativa]
MEDYLNGIDEELWNCINGPALPPANVQTLGASGTSNQVSNQGDHMKKNEKRCMQELRGALPPVVYNYIRGCKTTKDIWITLKEKYQGSEKTKINSVKQCLVELKEFRQKDAETIENYYDRLNELIYRCSRYGITRSPMEFNLIFIMGLRKEWRSVSIMIKNQQSFDTSSLNDLHSDCMLRKKDEKKSKVKDEAYYAEKLEEVRRKGKWLSLVEKGEMENDESGTYQIWSSGSDDEEMKHSTHGAMFASFEKNGDEEEEISGHCFVSKSTDKSPMSTKILKKTETSTLDSQNNYADVDNNSDNMSEISEIEEEEEIDCSKLSVINITSKVKGKEILANSIVKVDTEKPSTLQLFDFDDVEVQSSQIDDTDDDEENVKTSCECEKEKNVSTETSPTRIVFEQVYGDSKEFNQIHNDKGAHYLETKTVVYPNFTCTDKTIFPNQVFITAGNVEKFKPKFHKMPSQKWVVKHEKEEKVFQKDGATKSEVKLNSHEFKVMVGKFSCENNVSKRKVRKAIFWQIVSNEKLNDVKPQDLKNKNVESIRKYDNIRKYETSHNFVNDHKFQNVGKSTNNSPILNDKTQTKTKFSPKQPKFPNHSITKPTKLSYTKGKSDVNSINTWLEGKGKQFQNGKYSQQIKTVFKKYVNEFYVESLSSHGSIVPIQKWKPVMKVKHVAKDEVKIKENPKLSNNFISISRSDDVDLIQSVKEKMMCDKQYDSKWHIDSVVFNEEGNIISKVNTNEVLLKSKRYGDMFTLDINLIVGKPAVCLLSKASNDISWLWHRRLSHLNFRNINKLVTEDLVRACKQGKQHRKGHPIIIDSNIIEPLELLHIELCGLCFIMNLKYNLSKFDAKADEGIFLGYSHNFVAYRLLNKRTRKVEETFNLTFDDYFVKKIDRKFEQKPIIADSNNPVENENTIDFDYELIFGIPDRVIDAEIHAVNNQSLESSKHIDDSPHTSDSNSSESMPNVRMEGEHTTDEINVQDRHTFEGEKRNEDQHVEGEHQYDNQVEGELEGSVEGEYEVDDNISVAETKNEEVYEDAPLDFDPTYPPLEKWTKSHPKEQVIGNPQDGVLTRAQIRAKSESQRL